jgi:MFS family permease
VSSLRKSSRLRRIVGAYTVNRLGTWFGFVALSVAVYDRTHSAPAVAALLVCAQVIPALLSPALVARVEIHSRRGALSALYAVEALATVALAILVSHFSLAPIVVLVAIDGTIALAASALLRAAAARTASSEVAGPTPGGFPGESERGRAEEERHEAERGANAALNMAFSATFVLGPAIAGVLVAAAGASAALYVDAASFLICGAMLGDLRPRLEEGEGESSVRARLRAAWQHIEAVPALRTLLITEALALVFFEFAGPIEVVYAKVTLAAGNSGYGVLLTAWGVGVVGGSIVFARSARRSVVAMLSLGTLGVGVAYLGFAAAPSLLLACLAAVCGGLGNGIQWASLISAVQRLTPQHLHGCLMGAVESLGSLCPAIGLSAGGALVALSSPRTAFMIAGAGAVTTTIVFLRLSLDESPTEVQTPVSAFSETPPTP